MDVTSCRFCSTTSPITSDYEFDGESVQYFMRPNGELIQQTAYMNCREGWHTEDSIETFFCYCPFCGRKFPEDED